MGAGNSGLYNNTKGSKSTLSNRISSLPKNPNNLTKQGWKETTPPSMASKTSSRTFTDKNTGLNIRFDKGNKGAGGYGGKDHSYKKRTSF